LQEELKKRLNARIQYAKFLQDTVGEMAKELKTSKRSELHRTADDLDDFMQKVFQSLFQFPPTAWSMWVYGGVLVHKL
jgi:predicted translin family RNA/ssDNA-binding protein